jgi:hypothetical protein
VLEGVLKRYDLLDQMKGGERPTRPPASHVATTTPITGLPSPPAVEAHVEPIGVSPGGGMVRLSTAVTPASEASMASALAEFGVVSLTVTPVHRTVVHHYRGAESEQRVLDHLRLDADTTFDRVDDLRAAILRTAADTGQPEPSITETAGPHVVGEDGTAALHVLPAARSA